MAYPSLLSFHLGLSTSLVLQPIQNLKPCDQAPIIIINNVNDGKNDDVQNGLENSGIYRLSMFMFEVGGTAHTYAPSIFIET